MSWLKMKEIDKIAGLKVEIVFNSYILFVDGWYIYYCRKDKSEFGR